MKAIVVSKAHEKLSEFLVKQGSFEICYSIDSIKENIDLLTSNIIRVSKLIIVFSDEMDFASEIRSLMTLLSDTSGLLRIEEIIFFYKYGLDTVHIVELIGVVGELIRSKSSEDERYFAPNIELHELKTLSFDVLYKELMGKSTVKSVTPETVIKYRVERGEKSKKAFEPSYEEISIIPYETVKLDTYLNLRTVLQKTENPSSIASVEAAIPEYESLKLKAYHDLVFAHNKWILMTGDRMSGSTTHTTAMAVSAVSAGKTILALDFSSSGGLGDSLKMANVAYHMLSAKELLCDSFLQMKSPICVYENNSREAAVSLLSYIQSRPNVFSRDLILVSFDLKDIDIIYQSVNIEFCSVIISSLMFKGSVNKLLEIPLRDAKTLVWLNDTVSCPLRCRKYTPDYIQSILKKKGFECRLIEPIFFEDFELDGEFYKMIEGVI